MTHEPIEGYAHVGYGYVPERLPASDLVERLTDMRIDPENSDFSRGFNDAIERVDYLLRKHMEAKPVGDFNERATMQVAALLDEIAAYKDVCECGAAEALTSQDGWANGQD